MPCIEARGLRKRYGATVALGGIDLVVEEGRIVGLLGPNGAGKTTALKAILGLTRYEGELDVLGCNPWADRPRLMEQATFIADVAVLPRWLRVRQALDYAAGVHPRFDRAKAERFLARTSVKLNSRVRQLSRGMVTQLHLAIVMAIDSRLLILDEPTLGLDILFRKQFYDTLLDDYFDGQRTIVIATHQIEEVEHLLSDVVFIDRGAIALAASVDEIDARYTEVVVRREHVEAARNLRPLHERQVLGQPVMLFEGIARGELAALGDARRPALADLFVAKVGDAASAAPPAATRAA